MIMFHGFYFYRWWGKTIDQKSVEIKSRWKSFGCWLAKPLVSWVTRYPSRGRGGVAVKAKEIVKHLIRPSATLLKFISKAKSLRLLALRPTGSGGGTSHFCFTNSEAHYGSHLFEKPCFSQQPSKWSPGVHLGSSELFSPHSSRS